MIPPDLRGKLNRVLGYSGFPNYMDILSFLSLNKIFLDINLVGVEDNDIYIWDIYMKTIRDKEIYIFAHLPSFKGSIIDTYNHTLDELCNLCK